MKTSLRILLFAVAAFCLLPAGAQNPAGYGVPDLNFAVDIVERAYAGYASLKERLAREGATGRDSGDAVAEYLGWFEDSHLKTPGVDGSYKMSSP